ncbi:TetR/AcrR family transcriptional regulator [Plantactinospora sp. GCM10030261]|uniref:TetR/AcrR family transcriptional regulator n=1 Tax=Plantactinospora sp. GCM10030261 TaxID=3273420 RepID=UPI00360ACEBE
MSPRASVAAARQTRAAILAHAVDLASVEGLAGLTIGRLATDLGISKSGLLGHFGTKESLQLAVVERAAEIFWHKVWTPVTDTPPGLPRLRAVCDAWVDYVERAAFPGGCFFVATIGEVDDRPGPVRDAVRGCVVRWRRELSWQIELAVRAGELSPETDPQEIIFALGASIMMLNHELRLHGDRTAVDRARRAMSRALDRPPST